MISITTQVGNKILQVLGIHRIAMVNIIVTCLLQDHNAVLLTLLEIK